MVPRFEDDADVCYKGEAMSDQPRTRALPSADAQSVARDYAYPFSYSASWRFS